MNVNVVHLRSVQFSSWIWLIFLVNWNECEWTWLIFLVNWNLSSTRCGTNNPFKFLFISNFHKKSVPYYLLLFSFTKIMHIFGLHILLLFHELEWTQFISVWIRSWGFLPTWIRNKAGWTSILQCNTGRCWYLSINRYLWLNFKSRSWRYILRRVS